MYTVTIEKRNNKAPQEITLIESLYQICVAKVNMVNRTIHGCHMLFGN
jgi:hypothetical protein